MEYGSDGVTICARSRVAEATCRACGVRSGRVHSRYVRRLSDGVLGRRPVVIALTVRRFVCLDSQCATKTFVEQVDGLSEPNRRRTTPLLAMLGQVGLALAGRAGARLAAILGIKVDRTTLLRLVRPDNKLMPIPDACLGHLTELERCDACVPSGAEAVVADGVDLDSGVGHRLAAVGDGDPVAVEHLDGVRIVGVLQAGGEHQAGSGSVGWGASRIICRSTSGGSARPDALWQLDMGVALLE
ncbi:transposase family protein [Saccharopolyspora sp. NPDC000995]